MRLGTTVLIVQARGHVYVGELNTSIYRAELIGVTIGLILVLLQVPLQAIAFHLIDGSAAVENAAAVYFNIRIWSAPATMVNLAILGFFLGKQDSRTTLKLQLLQNGINIILDVIFVLGFGWGVAGVASATLIAEYFTLMAGIYLTVRSLNTYVANLRVPLEQLFNAQALIRVFRVNRDILIRTLCLIFAFAWFTNQGALAGDVVLAANAILLQLVSFAAFFLDGFALTAESLVGHAVGSENKAELRTSILLSTQLACITALLLATIYYFLGGWLISFITNVDSVIATCLIYLPWAIASPILSVLCYQLDGIFIGATRTLEMRNAMIVSLMLYLMVWWIFSQLFGNHGLWASLMLFFLFRATTLLTRLHTIIPHLLSIAVSQPDTQ